MYKISGLVSVIIILCLLSVKLYAAQPEAQYELTIEQENPTIGYFTLSLPVKGDHSRNAFIRSQNPSVKNVLNSLRCTNPNLTVNETSNGWSIPAKCKKLAWEIRFKRLDSLKYDVSKQKNIYSPASKWWVISEQESILRVPGFEDAQVCIKAYSSTSKTRKKCTLLPKTNEPPLLLPFGDRAHTEELEGTNFNIYIHQKDSKNSSQLRSLVSQFGKTFTYLKDLNTTQKSTHKNVDIVWVEIDPALNTQGGAAGSSAFLANFSFNQSSLDSLSAARLLWISGHELMHMLSSAPLPLWMAESLAHYYGYKALKKTGFNEQILQSAFESLKSHANSSPIGLLEAQHQVAELNQRQYYPLFYSKGSLFWKVIDEAIQKNNNSTSLDDFLNTLFNYSYENEKASLPDKFVLELEKVLGKEKLSEIINIYL